MVRSSDETPAGSSGRGTAAKGIVRETEMAREVDERFGVFQHDRAVLGRGRGPDGFASVGDVRDGQVGQRFGEVGPFQVVAVLGRIVTIAARPGRMRFVRMLELADEARMAGRAVERVAAVACVLGAAEL